MMWSDCYATLAVAADRTSKIKLGTGVAVSGTRPAPVTAGAIATINAIAPGRTFCGVGSGNTAMRVMGKPPHRIAQFDAYLATLRPLLCGEESTFEGQPIRHIMPDKGFVNFEDPIPLYISGFGPRSLGLAGKHGDGAVLGVPKTPDSMEKIWNIIEEGARDSGRSLDREDFYTTAVVAMVVLEDGESPDSDRVKSQCGASAMATIHFVYEQYRNFGRQPPDYLAGIWDDYTALLETYDEAHRHQRIHGGHNCWVLPDEERFLTEGVLKSTSLIGTRGELIERLRALGDAGLDQVMILPNFDTRFDVLESVARDLIGEV